jgi:DNA polymerase IIIc chi subunit
MLRALDGEVNGATWTANDDKFLPHNLTPAGHDHASPAKQDVVFSLLDGNIGHLALNSLEDDGSPNRFAAVFDRISRTDALVVDLRDNTGRGSDNGWKILAYLMGRPFNTVRWMGRSYVLIKRGFPCHGEGRVTSSAGVWSASAVQPYTRPVAVLIGPRCGSAAEDFAVTFDAARRGDILGEPTGRADDGPGVQPHRLVRPSVSDTRAGRDMVQLAAWHSLVQAATQWAANDA